MPMGEYDTEHILLHVFHIINIVFCTLSLFPMMLISVVLLRDRMFSRDRVGNTLIAHMILPVLMYSISTITLSISWLVNDHGQLPIWLYQLLGFLFNLGLLTFPFSVGMRYSYYFWLVALERKIKPIYWFVTLIVYWATCIVLLISVGILNVFSPHSSALIVTVPYTSHDPLSLTITIIFLCIMVLGGITHAFFAFMILLKFSDLLKSTSDSITPNTSNKRTVEQTEPIQLSDVESSKSKVHWINKSRPQRVASASEKAILRKFLPATIVYTCTHVPFICFVLYENITQNEAPVWIQCIYTLLYSISCFITPFVIIRANRKIAEGIGFLFDDIFRRG
ncbi:hypothetical protein K502DRAFT_363228 [Neoconidiobolus thromboides FSU 785]|nr:hypothetical protein K502DRAFT_363228 [Neoconidiobolus thromboides FSU 785]